MDFTHQQLAVNGEPEHNTDSIFCWCAPRPQHVDGTDTDIVVHRSLSEIANTALALARDAFPFFRNWNTPEENEARKDL